MGGSVVLVRKPLTIIPLLKRVREQEDLSDMERYLLLTLMIRMDNTKLYTWVSVSRLAKDLGWGRATVFKHLPRLEALGYIQRISGGHGLSTWTFLGDKLLTASERLDRLKLEKECRSEVRRCSNGAGTVSSVGEEGGGCSGYGSE